MKLSLVLVLLVCQFHSGWTRGLLPVSTRQTTLPCLSICFVLDGSSTPQQFQDQKNFVDLIIAIVGTDTAIPVGAVIATKKKPDKVSAVTAKVQFLPALRDAVQPGPAPAAVRYKRAMRKCKRLLKNASQVGVIVLFGSNPPRDTNQATKFTTKWVPPSRALNISKIGIGQETSETF